MRCRRRNCGKDVHGKKLCRKHYDESRKDKCPGCESLKKPKSLVCDSCARKRRGEESSSWKGGRIIRPDGYVWVYKPDDPRANCGRYMREHTLVLEEFLGRKLVRGETAHHRNGDRADNRIENLELWSISQPAGQRVKDKIQWAKEILALYEDEKKFYAKGENQKPQGPAIKRKK